LKAIGRQEGGGRNQDTGGWQGKRRQEAGQDVMWEVPLRKVFSVNR